jgi:hypothetical protein
MLFFTLFSWINGASHGMYRLLIESKRVLFGGCDHGSGGMGKCKKYTRILLVDEGTVFKIINLSK